MKAIEYGALIRGITSNMNEYIREVCFEHGIKYGQFEYFIIIVMTPGINQLEISKIKNVGKASVTKTLKQLEKDQFIIRKVDQTDKRNIRCFVSGKGKKIADTLIVISSKIESNLFFNFSDKEKSKFYEYLLKLNKNSENLKNTINKFEEQK